MKNLAITKNSLLLILISLFFPEAEGSNRKKIFSPENKNLQKEINESAFRF